MKLVFACSSDGGLNKVLVSERVPHILCSMIYLSGLKPFDYAPNYFLLDSGAFSVWKSGATIDLDDYAQTIVRMKARWPHTIGINLDVIPGTPGQPATPDHVKSAMQASLRNADDLRGRGLDVMEVFHMGEPLAFLDQLLERRPTPETILGLSPRKDLGQQKQREWIEVVLGHLVRNHGIKQLPRFHGLGVTAVEMLETFPFYSVDSTSWANSQIWGQRLNERGRLELLDKTLGVGASRSKALVRVHVHRAVQGYRRIEANVTRMWEKRGVVWLD